jgi:hypothetical protein
MIFTKPVLMGLAVTFSVAAPSAAVAQADEEAPPTIHHITTSTFHVPYGGSRPAVMNWIEDVMVPLARMNDDVVSYRVAQHTYGTGGRIVFITEYASWDAVNRPCEPCNAAFEEMTPEEGTPERETWDANLAAFLKAYSHHKDEMYAVNMDTSAK